MAKNKLKKFAELSQYDFVFENFDFTNDLLSNSKGVEVGMKGKWAEFFGNDKPITIEFACGGGEYTVALAKRYPDRNFIGVDIKGARLWKGAQVVEEHQLKNVAFVRTRIEMAETIFAKDEISEIWVTFPDPHLREAKAQKRLTSDRFIDLYRKFVKKGSIIQLKTDEPNLYEFTVETAEGNPFVHLLEHYDDIYSLDELPQADLDIKTYYEAMHLENKKTIKYIKTQLK